MSIDATFEPLPVRSPLESFERGDWAPDPSRDAASGATGRAAATEVRKPHVCFLAPTTWPVLAGDTDIKVVGGAEVQQSMIMPALAKRGYKVSMISLDYGQPDRAEVQGITVHKTYKPDAGIPVLRFLHPRLTSLWSTLKRVDADVYYQRTAAINTAVMAEFCRRHGKKSIYAGASDVDFIPGEEDIQYARDRKIFQHGVRRVDRIITQNATQRETLLTNYGRDSTVIQSCYVPKPGAKADRAGCVLWVASVRPSKRVELMFEIARRLPSYPFVVIGGPDPGRKEIEYFESMRAIAAKMPNVRMLGFLPFSEAEEHFNGARVFVNTSRYEGFPNTFMQAWARGIPTVGFVDTGSRRDGHPLYDIVNDVSDASWKVERLMRDDIGWQQASQRVAAHFRDCHSIDNVIDRYERELAIEVDPR